MFVCVRVAGWSNVCVVFSVCCMSHVLDICVACAGRMRKTRANILRKYKTANALYKPWFGKFETDPEARPAWRCFAGMLGLFLHPHDKRCCICVF